MKKFHNHTLSHKPLKSFILLCAISFCSLITFLYFFIKPHTLVTKTQLQTTQAQGTNQKQVYTNTHYQFSFPVATNSTIQEASFGTDITSIAIRTPYTKPTDEADFQLLVFTKELGTAIHQNFNTYYLLPNNLTKRVTDSSGAQVMFTKVNNRMIGKQRAIDFTSSKYPIDPQAENEIGVYIELGDNIAIFSTSEKNKAALEAMLRGFTYPL